MRTPTARPLRDMYGRFRSWSWVDCNEQGQDHDWGPTPELRAVDCSYWRCRRCPVSTRTSNRPAEPVVTGVGYMSALPNISYEQPVRRPVGRLP
jgi:hypothetical protein